MKLAIYDFDGTLVHVNTLPLLYQRWKRMKINETSRRPIWRRIVIRYIFHKLHLFGWNKRRFNPYTMEQTAELFGSVDQETLSRFLDVNYTELQGYISEQIRTQLKQDKEDGFHTVLLSGNFDIILDPFRQLGFDTIIGTPSHKDGRLRRIEEVHVIIQQGKRDMILQEFPDASLEDSKAYADSGYDLPILEMVGHPVAVNPDTQLYKHAKAHHWEILYTK